MNSTAEPNGLGNTVKQNWARSWWPVLFWAGVIFWFSTSEFSAANTGRFILPILHWFFPSASAASLAKIHFLIRKCGHFTEYFVLSLLLLRGIRAGRHDLQLRWAILAIAIVAGYATLDELHQSLTPGRGTLELSDVLLDTASGAAAQAIAAIIWRARRKKRPGAEGRSARVAV